MIPPTEIAEIALSEETVIRLFSDGSAILEFVEPGDDGDLVFAQLTPAEVFALRDALLRPRGADTDAVTYTTLNDELAAERAWLHQHHPRATSVHEMYSPMAAQVHRFFDAGIQYYGNDSGGLARWRAGMRVAAIRLAAMALKAIDDFHLASGYEAPHDK